MSIHNRRVAMDSRIMTRLLLGAWALGMGAMAPAWSAPGEDPVVLQKKVTVQMQPWGSETRSGYINYNNGLAAWQQAGLPVEATPDSPTDAECIDYLFFVHDRHDGNKEAARRYLAWETGLVPQLDAQELAAFRLPEHALS
jgi:hypothetical protein